jgi:YD repeat-containing protein
MFRSESPNPHRLSTSFGINMARRIVLAFVLSAAFITSGTVGFGLDAAVFGPVTFDGRGSRPVADIRRFTIGSVSGPYKLRVINHGIVDAAILLNRRIVLSPDDLRDDQKHVVPLIERAVTLRAGTNEVVVGLRGDVGTSLTVEILGPSLDNVRPTITASVTPASNAAGWNNSDVTVTFICSDLGSGIATCPMPVTVVTEGAGQIISGTAVDKSGNTATTSVTLNVDKTAPIVTATKSPSPNANGWNNTPVVVTFTAADSLSDVVPGSITEPTTLSAEGRNLSAIARATDHAGNIGTVAVGEINIDRTPPTGTVSTSPSPNESGWNDSPVTVHFSCADVGSEVVACPPDRTISTEADEVVMETVTDLAGNATAVTSSRIKIDLASPTISATVEPLANADGWHKTPATVRFTCADARSGITACSEPVLVSSEGTQSVEGTAIDRAGHQAATSATVNLDQTPPVLRLISPANGSIVSTPNVTITGTAMDGLSGVANVTCNASEVSIAENGIQCGITLVPGPNHITATATDRAGNTTTSSLSISFVDSSVPAPPLDEESTSTFQESTEFLYTGPDATQTGVVAGAIDSRRAAVVRGTVLDPAGKPLAGVAVTVHGHPQFGTTSTRADGMFDMAVNGGGLLTIQYEKATFLPAHRQVQVPWQDFVFADDVVLVQLDTRVTTVELAPGPASVARGSVVTDADGTRQATLIFAEGGTRANLELPDGTVLSNQARLHVRATEYTVGVNGPRAMPGQLPPASAYTYAVELSADEAFNAGATRVTFDPPVALYVENFLGFPVGGAVPSGFYDRAKATWIPSQNGVVIKVLTTQNGVAELDTNGDGVGDDPAVLGALHLTVAEQQQLATLYQAGQTLWRVPIAHFTPWDLNWPWGAPDDAEVPPVDPASQLDPMVDNPTCRGGSIIECENQVLRESIPITGTPFSLNYRSDSVPGRGASYQVDVPLSNATLPTSVRNIILDIVVAGQRFTRVFERAANQRYTFTWDGKDAYGRTVQGKASAKVRVGYVYGLAYQEPRSSRSSFGMISGIPIVSALMLFRGGAVITLWRESQVLLGVVRGPLGGWRLSAHHTYHPRGKTIYQGDGTRRSTESMGAVISTVAGNGTAGFGGDNGPATEAQLIRPYSVAVASDGSLYIGDSGEPFAIGGKVRRVGADGIITTVAGDGTTRGVLSGGDGLPAVTVPLRAPSGVAVASDGNLYIAAMGDANLRRVGTDGIISTVVNVGGTGDRGGDGIPATAAAVELPNSVAVAADGSLYVTEFTRHQVRRIGADGIITLVAGAPVPGFPAQGGVSGFSGDGGPASQAKLWIPYGVAAAPDGSVYITDLNNDRVRRVGPDGVITTVAGNGIRGFEGDFGPATEARLNQPTSVAVAPDGSLYILDLNNRVRRVGPDGIITTVVGTGARGYSGDGGPAIQASLDGPSCWQMDPCNRASGLAFGPDGSLYIADVNNRRIRKVTSSLAGLNVSDVVIPSDDGTEVHVFTGSGRHLRTLNALTGALTYQFAYDSAGRLTSVTDGDLNVTSIERDGSGNAVSIVAPTGQRTGLTPNGNGYLASITNPSGHGHHMVYSVDGLLTTFTDPNGNTSNLTYDSLGRLVKDQNAANGFWTLSRTEHPDGYSVRMTSAENRAIVHHVGNLAQGDQRRLDVGADGTITETLVTSSATRISRAADGTITTTVDAPDARFGTKAPLASSLTVKLPSGLSLLATSASSVQLANATNPLSLTSATTSVTRNGNTFTFNYDATLNQHTFTSPVGRQRVIKNDAQGRVVQEQVTGTAALNYGYDARGRLISLTQGDGAAERGTTFAYNQDGYVAQVIDALGRTQSFSYDAVGRVTLQTLADDRVIQFSYDAKR